MNELVLVKSAQFGDMTCDIYGADDEFYMTREQIGTALEYENPRTAIKNIHLRHAERLDQFSRGLKLSPTTDRQDTIIYTRKGVMEICRHSNQPKADAFMDWVWDVMDDLITGKSAVISAKPMSTTEIVAYLAQNNVELEKRVDRIEESTREIAEKVDKAVSVFAKPSIDHWKSDMDAAIGSMAKQYGLSSIMLRGHLYKELEDTGAIRLQSRLSRMRTRLKRQGVTYMERQSLSKLDVISSDKRLRAMFEPIVRTYQARYSVQ